VLKLKVSGARVVVVHKVTVEVLKVGRQGDVYTTFPKVLNKMLFTKACKGSFTV
jgi:hypothetical protein